jgi:RNA recognition motif-containing protein
MSNKIYVGNLSFTTLEESLLGAFTKFGNVESCKLITDRDSGRSKGFGFVEMETAEAAQKAISSLDGSDFEGRSMKVNIAKPREKQGRSFSGNRW